MTKHHRTRTGPGNTSDHVRRQARLNESSDSGRNSVRQSFVENAPTTKEAYSVADSPRGGTGDAASESARSDKRAFHPQKTPFSSASRDVDRAATPDWPYHGGSKNQQPGAPSNRLDPEGGTGWAPKRG
jgi:hypothetical protein